MEGMDGMSLEEVTDGLNSFNQEIPPWALLMMPSMRTILNELKELKNLTGRVNDLETFKAVSEAVTTNLKTDNVRLIDAVRRLEEKVEKLEVKSDDQEQRNRSYCLLFHGCPENEGGNTDDIAQYWS